MRKWHIGALEIWVSCVGLCRVAVGTETCGTWAGFFGLGVRCGLCPCRYL